MGILTEDHVKDDLIVRLTSMHAVQEKRLSPNTHSALLTRPVLSYRATESAELTSRPSLRSRTMAKDVADIM